jgi:DNA repair protein RecO (recombination protein O)
LLASNELVFVLHTRNYRETSQLVDLYSRDHGRIRVIARGSRGNKKRGSISLQQFAPLLASWRGKTDLKTLTAYELLGPIESLQGRALYVGFYINELLCRLMPEHIPNEALFDRYAALLAALPDQTDPEPKLRMFELALLDELGYGINLINDAVDGTALALGNDYVFLAGEGFTRIERHSGQAPRAVFSGSHLLAIANHQFDSKPVRNSAKRLMRQALHIHLGDKPLSSRELFEQVAQAPVNTP